MIFSSKTNKLMPYALILLAPIFSNYVFLEKISIGDIFCLTFFAYYLFGVRFNILNILLIFFAVFLSFASFIILLDGDLSNGFYRLCVFYIMIFFFGENRESHKNSIVLVDCYLAICLFLSLSIIGQFFLYKIGISLSLQLPINYYEPDTLKVIDHVYRSGGWLKEPSYYVLYMMPAFFIVLLLKKKLLFYIFMVAGVLSTSSLLLVALVASIFYCLNFNKRKAILKYTISTFFVFFLIFLFLNIFGKSMFVERIVDIFDNGGTLNSRFLNSFDFLNDYVEFLPGVKGYGYFKAASEYDEVWFSSMGTIGANLGFLGIILLSVKILRFDFALAVLLICLLALTHVYSGVYIIFLCFLFSIVSEIKKTELLKEGNYV